jgi:hypothetical protein
MDQVSLIHVVWATYLAPANEQLCDSFNAVGKNTKFDFTIVAKDLVGNVYSDKGSAGSRLMV